MEHRQVIRRRNSDYITRIRSSDAQLLTFITYLILITTFNDYLQYILLELQEIYVGTIIL